MTHDTRGQHLLENVENWRLSGGSWRIVSISNERAVVDLCACTGEPMERLQSDDPTVIARLRTMPSSLDLD
jgi:hypothetical protein